MRNFLLLIVLAGFAACTGNKGAVEETLHVYGNCEKCKKTIDSAALAVKGVKSADWHIDSKLLTLEIDTAVTNSDNVLQSIANAGYDNEKFYGNDYAYGALPQCCQYERREHELK